jgi:hypothetical protein
LWQKKSAAAFPSQSLDGYQFLLKVVVERERWDGQCRLTLQFQIFKNFYQAVNSFLFLSLFVHARGSPEFSFRVPLEVKTSVNGVVTHESIASISGDIKGSFRTAEILCMPSRGKKVRLDVYARRYHLRAARERRRRDNSIEYCVDCQLLHSQDFRESERTIYLLELAPGCSASLGE